MKNMEMGTCSAYIPDDASRSCSGNPHGKVELCVGKRIVLTDTISVSNRLIIGSNGTIMNDYELRYEN